MQLFSTRALLSALKAAAEPTRLRILALLANGGLNVKDLTRVLGQSQPRISRHLKLLVDAGLIERSREGSWAFFHISDDADGGALARLIVGAIDRRDPALARDRQKAEAVSREREAAAQTYFAEHAAEWDRIRALHVAEGEVEAAMVGALGPKPINLLLDLGTGTGRMLELLAERYRRALGFDQSKAMLACARVRLEAATIAHAQVRHGDIYDLPLTDAVADVVIMHQVLHFLADPVRALREAARVLAPGGRLLIVDFAPHDLDFLRETQAHERLGFAASTIEQWLAECGLEVAETRHLAPTPAGIDPQKLTVSLWLATRPAAAESNRTEPARPATLERIA